jgi:hypothetical protein
MPNLRNLNAAMREKIARHFGGVQTQSKWNCYYSRVRFTCTSISALSYQIAAGAIVNAFSYGRGGADMASAGLSGVQSTTADTNIITPNQTVAGESVLIEGVGLIALTQSDANLLKAADQNISVTIKTNGTTDYLLGIPSMIPSPGGLFGASEAWSTVPSLPDQLSRSVGVISNGLPHISNYLPLPEPMLWSSAGRGDSTFNIQLKVERTVATLAQFSGAARTAASGVAPYTPPTAAQTFIDYMVVLVGVTLNPLSVY